eukprot:5641231-Amphidinium_carterae.1
MRDIAPQWIVQHEEHPSEEEQKLLSTTITTMEAEDGVVCADIDVVGMSIVEEEGITIAADLGSGTGGLPVAAHTKI